MHGIMKFLAPISLLAATVAAKGGYVMGTAPDPPVPALKVTEGAGVTHMVNAIGSTFARSSC